MAASEAYKFPPTLPSLLLFLLTTLAFPSATLLIPCIINVDGGPKKKRYAEGRGGSMLTRPFPTKIPNKPVLGLYLYFGT